MTLRLGFYISTPVVAMLTLVGCSEPLTAVVSQDTRFDPSAPSNVSTICDAAGPYCGGAEARLLNAPQDVVYTTRAGIVQPDTLNPAGLDAPRTEEQNERPNQTSVGEETDE